MSHYYLRRPNGTSKQLQKSNEFVPRTIELLPRTSSLVKKLKPALAASSELLHPLHRQQMNVILKMTDTYQANQLQHTMRVISETPPPHTQCM